MSPRPTERSFTASEETLSSYRRQKPTSRPTSHQSELDYSHLAIDVHNLNKPNQTGSTSALVSTNIELWLKFTLISAGLISLAQLGVAIWLELSSVTLAIDIIHNGNLGLFISRLPTLAAVTTQTIHIWVYAAIGLGGLWLWERRLSRPQVSFDEIAAWGGLVSGQSSAVAYKSRKIGVMIALVYFAALGLSIAASSAITSAVTLTTTNQTVPGTYSVPSIATTNATDPVPNTFNVINYRSVIFDAMGSIPQVNNLGWIQVGGAIIDSVDLGTANPGILQSFITNDSWRGDKFKSQDSFVQASLCLSGVAESATCTPATTPVLVNNVGTFNNSQTPNIITLAYTNACGQQITSRSLDNFDPGVPYVSACINNDQNFLDWVATGSFAGSATDPFPWNASTIQYNCAINLTPAAQRMRVYRRNGQVGVERDPGGPLCPPPDLTVSMSQVASTLNDRIALALRPATRDADFQRLVSRAGLDSSGQFVGLDGFGTVLAEVSGLAFRSLYTALVTTAFTYDARGDVLNYKGNTSIGVVTPTRETYAVAALGRQRYEVLALLGLAALAIVLSFGLLFRPVGVFDPSDAAAVAAVAVTVASGAGGAATTAGADEKPHGRVKGAYLPLRGAI